MFPLPARVQYNDYNQEELRIHVSNIVGGVGGVLGKYSCIRTWLFVWPRLRVKKHHQCKIWPKTFFLDASMIVDSKETILLFSVLDRKLAKGTHAGEYH